MAKKETPKGVAASEKEEAADAFLALGARKTAKGFEVVEVTLEGETVTASRVVAGPLPRAAAAERLRVETVHYMRKHL